MPKILVIDDSAVIRELLTEFLSDLGHQVDTAVDGADGLEKARSGDYDLCFCDLHLPKKNGYQVMTELGSDRGKMEFIFTDSLPDELGDKILDTTTFRYLRKPFDLNQVRQVLQQTLEKIRV